MLHKLIERLIQHSSLSQEESYTAGKALLEGADPCQAGAFLALLRSKGETAEEILGLIQAIREKSVFLHVDLPVLDIVGTGGDCAGTINISTGSALLAAACGVPIVKHGNQAVSSHCGSADVLEALGYDIHQSYEDLQKSLSQTGFAFCFAPDYHPALQVMRPIRRGLNIPTALHLIGPLLNPASIDHLILGVYDPKAVDLLAEVLFRLGTKKSIVFHGNGIDELSCLGPIHALLVTDKGKEKMTIDPMELGLKVCTLNDLKGKDVESNATTLRTVLSGKESALTDTLILNAATALFLYGATPSIEKGIERARERLCIGNIVKRNQLQEIVLRKKQLYHPHLRHHKSLKGAIKNSNQAIIAEIKRASPSIGNIAEISDPVERANAYIAAGAVAISVLTDEAFCGSMEDLEKIASSSQVPVLCKDFLIHPKQIALAACAGADAVLLIVTALQEETATFVQMAHLLGLEVLVEVHHEKELKIALDSGADVIGINQRDLSDFTMHPELFHNLINKIPQSQVKVAESGIRTFAQACELFAMGYDGVLVGEALSKRSFFEAGTNAS